ncbi:hypothetical protein [Pantoea sp. JK]|uniref:hypothetical protein n=1 Tax=Pantoea sp. JK TaxID=2871703 RepID=UPI0022370A6F|nr:hypothetical protein [Pantoea sp. JK]MCW6034466.1 hypothetical protein [Pantoea sp. JK]
MPVSPLAGRRIHITGSVPEPLEHASTHEVDSAREFIKSLVKELVKMGANFVIPIDAEKTRSVDGRPICFDWLVWNEVINQIHRRPEGVPGPCIIAVKHHKNDDQIPEEQISSWDDYCGTSHVKIESAAHWNMASKRMEIQARSGDILITIGGSEGVLFLSNLYHDAGKPVIPMNYKIGKDTTGSRKIFEFALASVNSERLFKTTDGRGSHDWINRLSFPARKSIEERVSLVTELLENLTPPSAFFVCLMNTDHEDQLSVSNFYETVVKHVMETEFGYKMVIVDGSQGYEMAYVNQEVFTRLHRSRVVIADLTASRPNCFLELGYALGRGLPTMITARVGTELPFDIHSVSTHQWQHDISIEEARRLFRNHWESIRTRPPLVSAEPLIP